MSGPLFGCKNPDCAAEVSYEPGMLSLWKGEPICEGCYQEEFGEDDPSWSDLPAFIPAADKRIAELDAENERLREMLTELANLGVPQNGRGCLYCGTMTTHKPVCEVPHILAALAAETPSEEPGGQ